MARDRLSPPSLSLWNDLQGIQFVSILLQLARAKYILRSLRCYTSTLYQVDLQAERFI
jgi:hypothetical protein